MLKRCHKCQKLYNTEEYFCGDCGTVLYDEKTDEKSDTEVLENNAQQKNSDKQSGPKTDNISQESNILIKQISLLRKYVTGGTFRACTFMVIAAVVMASIFEAFMQFATYTMQGEALTPYIASNIAFTLALSAFYSLLPAISMNKISMDAENYVSGGEGAFIWKAAKSLTYITVYFILQTIITGGVIGFVFNASTISMLSGEIGISVLLFLSGIFAAAFTLPYFISGLITFLTAKGSLKKAVPFTGRGAKCFGLCFMVISILSTAILVLMAVVFAVVKVSDISFDGGAPIMSLFSKMSGTYIIYIFIMLIRSVADIVIATGFLQFIKKLRGIKNEK